MIVTVNSEELLATLKKNRAKHHAIFLEACDGYQKKAIMILQEHIDRIKTGKRERVYVSLPEPVEHTFDYDRAIKMVSMHLETSFDLDEYTFGQLVMDEWDWHNDFLTSNKAYSATAASMSVTSQMSV